MLCKNKQTEITQQYYFSQQYKKKTRLINIPPEPRNLLPSLTWGYLSSRCLSGQMRVSEENTTLCLVCWNFLSSSLGPEAKTTS